MALLVVVLVVALVLGGEFFAVLFGMSDTVAIPALGAKKCWADHLAVRAGHVLNVVTGVFCLGLACIKANLTKWLTCFLHGAVGGSFRD